MVGDRGARQNTLARNGEVKGESILVTGRELSNELCQLGEPGLGFTSLNRNGNDSELVP